MRPSTKVNPRKRNRKKYYIKDFLQLKKCFFKISES